MIQTLVEPYTRFPLQPTPAFPNATYVDRPALLTSIKYQGNSLSTNFYSLVDSGADNCYFPAQFAPLVGINLTSGKLAQVVGIGSGNTYYHDITISVEVGGQVYSFDCYAGFMTELDAMGAGLLGHNGFFNLFKSITFDVVNGSVEFKVDMP